MLREQNIESHVVISEVARKAIRHETNYLVEEVESMASVLYDP
ncbi:hypothetical protein [Halalkalibacterium ligniniphilum]|nr:hypothetical protein [Halalkalibacterium ligniniphilum]